VALQPIERELIKERGCEGREEEKIEGKRVPTRQLDYWLALPVSG
jgi:DNA invertase Pin-like site-specific DNA recombinase